MRNLGFCLLFLLAIAPTSGAAQNATCTSAAGAEVTFENEGDQPVRIVVYDEAGMQVYPYPGGPDNLIDVNDNPLGFDGSALPAGPYLVRAQTAAGGPFRALTQRLVLTR